MAKRKTSFIHKPVYPGGKTALQAFLKAHLKYPKAALENKTEGSVKVQYSLNQSGKVMQAKAVSGPQYGCREEAVRLVKMLRFTIPKDYKMSVRYRQHMNINFKLPKPKKQVKKQATKITYTITNEKSKPKPSKDNGLGYTISW